MTKVLEMLKMVMRKRMTMASKLWKIKKLRPKITIKTVGKTTISNRTGEDVEDGTTKEAEEVSISRMNEVELQDNTLSL
jgi:hypothetical protein